MHKKLAVLAAALALIGLMVAPVVAITVSLSPLIEVPHVPLTQVMTDQWGTLGGSIVVGVGGINTGSIAHAHLE